MILVRDKEIWCLLSEYDDFSMYISEIPNENLFHLSYNIIWHIILFNKEVFSW